MQKSIVTINENEVPFHCDLVEANSREEVKEVVRKIQLQFNSNDQWAFVGVQAVERPDTLQELQKVVDEYHSIEFDTQPKEDELKDLGDE